jgi:hypothetical protein
MPRQEQHAADIKQYGPGRLHRPILSARSPDPIEELAFPSKLTLDPSAAGCHLPRHPSE